eukprot:1716878-Pyramimonas_sp.AAC.1
MSTLYTAPRLQAPLQNPTAPRFRGDYKESVYQHGCPMVSTIPPIASFVYSQSLLLLRQLLTPEFSPNLTSLGGSSKVVLP